MVCIIGIIFMPTGPTGRNSTSSTLRLLLLIFVRGTIESDSKKIWNQMKEQLSETSGKFWESVPERAASSFIFHEKKDRSSRGARSWSLGWRLWGWNKLILVNKIWGKTAGKQITERMLLRNRINKFWFAGTGPEGNCMKNSLKQFEYRLCLHTSLPSNIFN